MAAADVDVQPGDWVRFQIGGDLVIGRVEYVLSSRSAGGKDYDMIVTTVGQTIRGSILEVRRTTYWSKS